MDRAAITQEIDSLEAELLAACQRISAINETESMAGWLIEVIENDSRLCQLLHLPTKKEIREALLTILRTPSDFAAPMVGFLAQRTDVFMGTMRDVYEHPFRGRHLDPLMTTIAALQSLLEKYQQNFEHRKTIPLIAEALRDHRLHIYKSSKHEPDLRVALRAFYEDGARDDKQAIARVLDFILEDVKRELRLPGHISQPRHAWWAILTLMLEADASFLSRNRKTLNAAIRHLLRKIEYVPRKDVDFASLVPELHSPENEEIWVTVNAIRVYSSHNVRFLTRNTARALTEKIEVNVGSILQSRPRYPNLKLVQSRLIVCYEAASYRALRQSILLSTGRSIDVSSRAVGKFYYEDDVVHAVAKLKNRAAELVHRPDQWLKMTLSSVLISGKPGQGKSELGKQILMELGLIAAANQLVFEDLVISIGSDITTGKDLADCLAKLKEEKSDRSVRGVLFDEFDKANFDFCAYFLPILEEHGEAMKTFWLFAQSKVPTFSELVTHAESLEAKSLRDFLTRMQLAHLDLPDIRHSPEQRVYTALGIARSKAPALERVQRDLVLEVARRQDVETNRDIIRVVSSDIQLDDSCMHLQGDPRFRLADYPTVNNNISDWIPVRT